MVELPLTDPEFVCVEAIENKWCANRIILHSRLYLGDVSTYDFLFKSGAICDSYKIIENAVIRVLNK